MTNALEKRKTSEAVPAAAERTRTGRTYTPYVDIYETADELLLLAEMPGAVPDSVDVNFEGGELTISARVEPRQPAGTLYLLEEYGAGDYFRTFRISEAVDASRISAELKHGILTLHLPKVEAAKPRKIAVAAR